MLRPFARRALSALTDEALVLRDGARLVFSPAQNPAQSLCGRSLGLDAAKIDALLLRAAIDPGVRAESLVAAGPR